MFLPPAVERGRYSLAIDFPVRKERLLVSDKNETALYRTGKNIGAIKS